MGVYEIENLINLTLPRQRNLQFLKTAFILNGVQPGEAHVYPIFFIIHGFNTKEKSTVERTSWKLQYIYILVKHDLADSTNCKPELPGSLTRA